ncbi:MAG: inosine/xanthosine triphosphatase [Candidatus Berkelbacteria bacterium]|nr:inosine/xanthosine triphosphatase [Candidatus Berkelbacteria bacterium]
MQINIGTSNKIKVQALEEVVKDYPIFKNAEVNALSVSSGVGEQPRSLEQTIKGAINRAKEAYRNCNYSFGLESGLMDVPYTKTGYMNICVCAIFNGKNIYLGTGPGFEYPTLVTKYVFEKGMEIDKAFLEAKITSDPKIGKSHGAIGLLTKDRVIRTDLVKMSVKMAIIQLENPNLY